MSSMYPSFGGAPARPCARCGTPLTINETQCSRCGMFNPLPQGQQFGASQQGAQGGPSGPLWGGQAQQASQYQQAGNGAWSNNPNASASTWGSSGQAGGGWQQNNLFGGQDAAFPASERHGRDRIDRVGIVGVLPPAAGDGHRHAVMLDRPRMSLAPRKALCRGRPLEPSLPFDHERHRQALRP